MRTSIRRPEPAGGVAASAALRPTEVVAAGVADVVADVLAAGVADLAADVVAGPAVVGNDAGGVLAAAGVAGAPPMVTASSSDTISAPNDTLRAPPSGRLIVG